MSIDLNDRPGRARPDTTSDASTTADADHDPAARLGGLTRPARDLVDLAAVAGSPCHVEDLAEILHESVTGILSHVREALGAGLLESRPGVLSFRSSSEEAAVYYEIPEAVRPVLHRAVGLVLVGRTGSAARAAAHLVVGLRTDDPAALAALTRAAWDLVASAPTEAADLALRVLEVTDRNDESQPPRTLVAVAALTAAGRLPEAIDQAWAGLASPYLPGDIAARLHARLSGLYLATGRMAEAVAEAEAALRCIGPVATVMPPAVGDGPRGDVVPGNADTVAHSPVAGAIEAAESARLLGLMSVGDVSGARRAAEAVLGGVRGPGGDGALAMALSALALSAWSAGRVADALCEVRAAVGRAGRGTAPAAHARLLLAALLRGVGEYPEAANVLDEAVTDVELSGDSLWCALPALARAVLALHAGQLSDAERYSRSAIELSNRSGATALIPPARAVLTRVEHHRGDLASGQQHAGLDRRTWHRPAVGLSGGVHRWTEVLVLAAQEPAPDALQQVHDLYDALPATPGLLLEESWAAGELTRLALNAGDSGRALLAATCAEWLASCNPEVPTLTASATHARGLLEHRPALLEQAARQYPQIWSRGRAWEDAAHALLADDGRLEAARSLERALEAYDAMGAVGDSARVRSLLRGFGVHHGTGRRAQRPVSGWPSLTDAELRVASVVADGLTNAQVAHRLFVSRHTVDFHLRQVFRKLEVHSRTELVRAVLDHERHPGDDQDEL